MRAVLAVVLVLAALNPAPILASGGPHLTSSITETPPVIDGILSPGEWGTAVPVTLNGFKSRTDPRTGQLYLLNTSTDLFVAFVLFDPLEAPSDTVELQFDTDHDHSATAGREDALRYELGSSLDFHWQGLDWARDTTQDGIAVRAYGAGKYTYEFRKPLNSGDGQDMAARGGATLGFRIQANDAEDSFRFPTGTQVQGGTTAEWGQWADITIASSMAPPAAPSLTSPQNNFQLNAMTTDLAWTNPSNTTQVHVQVTPADNDGPGVNLILGSVTELRIPPPPEWYGLLPALTYTWRLRAATAATPLGETSSLWGPWSAGRAFRTPGRTSARLSLVSPADGSSLSAGSQVLRWANADTDVFYYEVQMSPDVYFGELGPFASVWHNLVHAGVANPPNSWRTPALAPGTSYYWRVRPRIQGDGLPVAWSPVWSVRTAAATVSGVSAGSGPSLDAVFASISPTIDGTFSAQEWGNPVTNLSLNGFNDPSRTRLGQLYVRNSQTELFLAVLVDDPMEALNDQAELNFDPDHDHRATIDKEDSLRYDGGPLDAHWRGDDWARDTIQHGAAARSYADGRYVYEFSKPLNSRDSQDMAVVAGATVGFRLQVYDSNINEMFRYPVNSRAHGDTTQEWARWSDLNLANVQAAPTAPILSQPIPGAQLHAMSSEFIWSNPVGTTQVQIQVIPANDDGPGVNLILGEMSTLIVPAPPDWYGLLPGMGYSWRARASSVSAAIDETSDRWGPWSDPQRFRTPVRDSSTLTPGFPTNTGTAPAGPQTLRWANRDSDVFYYEIQVSTDHLFGQQGPVAAVWHNLIHGGVTNPPNSWRTPDLLPGTPYFWRVRPRVQGDGVPVSWSPVWSFKI